MFLLHSWLIFQLDPHPYSTAMTVLLGSPSPDLFTAMTRYSHSLPRALVTELYLVTHLLLKLRFSSCRVRERGTGNPSRAKAPKTYKCACACACKSLHNRAWKVKKAAHDYALFVCLSRVLRTPHPPLISPVRLDGERLDVGILDVVASRHGAWQEEQVFLNVRGEEAQVHDLGYPGTADVAEAGQVGHVLDFAFRQQPLKMDSKRHKPGQARYSARLDVLGFTWRFPAHCWISGSTAIHP